MSTTNATLSNSFDLLEQIHKDGFEECDPDLDEDDATVPGANVVPPSLTRITFKVPGNEMAKDKPKAILLAAKEVIDCLQVEFPLVKLLPWKTEEATTLSNIKGSLPTNPKLAETFLFGYSRFFAKPNGIFCLLLQQKSRDKDIPTAMANFFNNLTRDTSKPLFGTPMMFVSTPMGWQNITRLSRRVRTQILGQATIVASLSSIGLDNIDLMNKINDDGQTLIEALMSISSITPKKNKHDKEIFGRLFHAITPTTDPASYTISFFNVNLNEASSVIAALPLFIESEFLISAKKFCRTTFIEAAKVGQWDPDTRLFLSQEDLAMGAMLEQIVKLTDTPPAGVIISSDHQRFMAMTEDVFKTISVLMRNQLERILSINKELSPKLQVVWILIPLMLTRETNPKH